MSANDIIPVVNIQHKLLLNVTILSLSQTLSSSPRMVSHRGHNCISSALTILDSAKYCQHTAMYDLGCPRDYTVDIHVITMVRIRLWLFGITSAMLDLRMLQLLCRLPIKLHS